MRVARTIAVAVAAGGLAGCVVAPPPQHVAPLIAVPGPTKTAAQFQADDMACRVAAVPLPEAPAANRAAPAAGGTAAAAAQVAEPVPPGALYLHCMAARGNGVQPLTAGLPYPYGYYAPYPIWARYGGGYPYPFFYDNYISFGFYGGGYYGGYGRGGYGRGGYYGGGFRGGPGGGFGGGPGGVGPGGGGPGGGFGGGPGGGGPGGGPGGGGGGPGPRR